MSIGKVAGIGQTKSHEGSFSLGIAVDQYHSRGMSRCPLQGGDIDSGSFEGQVYLLPLGICTEAGDQS